jgi:putative oligomerization/nucleic acid binding protein
MFGKKKERPPIIEAPAVVLSLTDTGMTINDNPRVKITLQVTPPDGAEPFVIERKATVSRVRIPREGDRFRVQYFVGDPDSAKLQRRTDEDIAASAVPAASVPAAEDPLDRLQKLAQLRESGVLTEAEFAEAKARILTAT